MGTISPKVGITIAVLLVLAVIGNAMRNAGITPSSSKPEVPPSPVAAKCTLSPGSLWTGVTLYSDNNCQQPIGKVLGGSRVDGQKTVRIEFTDGTIEDKLRTAVTQQAYVMTNDPAIASHQWREF